MKKPAFIFLGGIVLGVLGTLPFLLSKPFPEIGAENKYDFQIVFFNDRIKMGETLRVAVIPSGAGGERWYSEIGVLPSEHFSPETNFFRSQYGVFSLLPSPVDTSLNETVERISAFVGYLDAEGVECELRKEIKLELSQIDGAWWWSVDN